MRGGRRRASPFTFVFRQFPRGHRKQILQKRLIWILTEPAAEAEDRAYPGLGLAWPAEQAIASLFPNRRTLSRLMFGRCYEAGK